MAIKNGVITASTGNKPGENVFLTWTDPNPMAVTKFAIMTGWGSRGEWYLRNGGTL